MIKLVLLKSGEEVITDIEEMVVNEKVVGYFFNKPCSAKLFEDIEEDEPQYSIKLTPWIPLSSDDKIPVVTDWVISIMNPIDKLKEMYEKGVKKNGTKTDTSDESTNLGLTD